MKKIRLFFVILMLGIFSNVFSAPISTYEELTTAMRNGDRFVIVLDLAQCTSKLNMPTGYFAPNSMLLMPATEKTNEKLMTSLLHFRDHLDEPAYEYIKFTFNPDNTVVIRKAIYHPQTFTLIGTPQIFNCSFGCGIEINSNF